jgi:hypothetical protein
MTRELELGTSKGADCMDQDRGLRGSRKLHRVGEKNMKVWATMLVKSMKFWAAVLVFGGVALADEHPLKEPLRLTYLVTADERTVVLWGPGVSEAPAEIVTGNKVLLPVPAQMAERIQAIVSKPGDFPDGSLEYVIVLKGGGSTRVCHTENGNFHCHPPS